MIYSSLKGGILMKKSNTVLKSIFACFLSAVLLMSVFPVMSFAGVTTIIDPEQKLQHLYTFNESVNNIKENKPSFTYKKTAGMNRQDESYYYLIGSKTAAEVSDEANKYLSVIIDAFFNPDRGLVKNFIGALTDTNSDTTEKQIIKGEDTTYSVPLYGKPFVSELTVDDGYTLRVEESSNLLDPAKNTKTMRFEFPECDLENVDKTALKKVFDLPSGSIDPVIISGGNLSDSEGPLSEVKFDNFTFSNAYVQAQYNADGELINYTQNISYTFSMSFYDIMRVFGAYTDIDLIEIGLAIANPILVNTGNPEVTARDILKDSVMYIRYDIKTVLTDFDWEPRFFGDIDNDGDVDAYDARTALRYSVGLEKIKSEESLVYGDVNFDGAITAADARFILRGSVGLEKLFEEVPEGESIKIIEIKPPEEEIPEEPEDPEDPEEPEVPEEGDGDDKEDDVQLPSTGEVADGITEFINTIFDVINGIKGDGVTNEGIAGMIQQIKDIVAAGKNDKSDGGDGGFVPYG